MLELGWGLQISLELAMELLSEDCEQFTDLLGSAYVVSEKLFAASFLPVLPSER